MKAGEADEAAAAVDAGLTLSEAFGETLNVPELLRVRGEIWLQKKPAVHPVAAERAFHLALHQAKEQSALSFELRVGYGACATAGQPRKILGTPLTCWNPSTGGLRKDSKRRI